LSKREVLEVPEVMIGGMPDMRNLYANTLNETQKILFKRKNMAILAVSALIPALTAGLIILAQNQAQISVFRFSDYPVLVLGLFTNVLLPLFVFMWIADTFAGEFGDNTLKLTLLRPITRYKVYVSKINAAGILILITLLVAGISALLAGMILDESVSLTAGELFKILLVYLAATVPLLALAIAAAFIAQFFKGSSGALVTSVFVYLLARALSAAFPGFAKVSLFSYLDWHWLWLGSSLPFDKIGYALLIIFSSSLIFFAAGAYLFDTKNL
jgi:ABC-2 type transport system permease protein